MSQQPVRRTVGDTLTIVQRVRSAVPRPAPAKPYRYSELVTMRAELAALRNGSATRVPCSMSFTNISGWRPWQQMDADISCVQRAPTELCPPVGLETSQRQLSIRCAAERLYWRAG